MRKGTLKKEKWTLSFDFHLKQLIIQEAKKKGVYPVHLLEEIMRERYNPYGHTDIRDSVRYVQLLRQESRSETDEAFLKEIHAWQRSSSS
jgi:hypothetical protein